MLAALGSGIVLVANAALSLMFRVPPYSPSQRVGFLVVGCAFGAVAAGIRAAGGRSPDIWSAGMRWRVVNIVLGAYLLGVLLPGIRFVEGQQSLAWTIASSAAVLVVSCAIALLSIRSNGAASR